MIGRSGERGAQRWRNPPGTAVPTDAGNDNVERREDRAAATDPLIEKQPRPANLDDSGLDIQQIVQPRRLAEIGGDLPDGKDNAGFGGDAGMREAEVAHHFGARSLDEF